MKRKLIQERKDAKRYRLEATNKRSFQRQTLRQYGGGDTVSKFTKKTHFPTTEEKAFFYKHVVLTKDTQMRRQNAAYLALDTTRMKFIGLDKIENDVMHNHIAQLIDIFIRMMIEKSQGNLKTTRYWFQITHPGYENNEFYVTHKTYDAVDGGVIMNKIASHMQSNEALGLDEHFTVAMNVFVPRKQGHMQGRGGIRGTEKIRNKLMENNFGIKNNRVIGSSHCAVKALALGKMETDIKCLDNGDPEKEKMMSIFRNLTRQEISLNHREKAQLFLAKKMLEEFKMDPNQEVHDRTDIVKIAGLLPEYQIKLWGMEGYQNVASEMEHFNPNGSRFIGLFYYRGHYEFISHILRPQPSRWGKNFYNPQHTLTTLTHVYMGRLTKSELTPVHDTFYRFCYKCSKFGDTNHWKFCPKRCRRCGTYDCMAGSENILCNRCNIYFRSQQCYDAHIKATSRLAIPYCKKFFYCKKCLMIDRTNTYRKAPHICGTQEFCQTCREKVARGHTCKYRVPTEKEIKKKRKEQEDWKIIIYDMECVVAESGVYDGSCVRGPTHEPNMICADMFCSKCIKTGKCEKCLPKWNYSYKDTLDEENGSSTESDLELEDTIDDDSFGENMEDIDIEAFYKVRKKSTPLARFCKFLLESPIANNAYIIAHNGGRYDHTMVLAELDRQRGLDGGEPSILLNGNTIITAEFRCKSQILYFRDSFQYLPMALSKMPQAFGLDGEAKGDFPHLFNHPDNYGKILSTLPPKEYYSPEFKSVAVREEFDKWYEESFNKGFVFYDELLKYCESDVRILRLTMIAFIQLCGELFNGWNPIIQGCTLASFVMFVLKHEYIEDGDVGYIPERGYGCDRNSALALKYLQWIEKKNPSLHLQHQLRGGEHQIEANDRSYKVDGFNEATNEVFEVYGCLWHGCLKCQPIRDRQSPMCKATPRELYDRTMRREKDLKNAGYTVHVIWECEIYELLEKDCEMKKFFTLNKYTRRLNPRDGVFGGRTQAFRSLTKADEDTVINFFDYNSMYPYLNAGGTEYPRGNPTVLTDNLPDPAKPLTLRGIVYCDMLPAVDAEMGYLPDRFSNKLMFTLCRSCAENQNTNGQCTHLKVSERYLTGVWTTDELNKAISKGYKVLKYHEIWYWKDWMKGGFFAGYIKPLLKIKHESSGWPRENMTENEKQEYVDNIFKNDGVQLDPSNIKRNNGLRSLTKILMNSAWGKFAQNPMKTETKLILKSDAETLTNFMNDPKFKPNGLVPFGENKLFISRIPKKEAVRNANFTNLAIGIITCSAGRLRLIEAIERVGVKNTIYCDTDSVIFKQKCGEDPLGDLKGGHLGYLVSEIPEGKRISETVVMAPKSYCLEIVDEKGTKTYRVKSKGLTMTCENAKKITFENMKKAMTEFIEHGVTEPMEGEMLVFKRGDHALDGLWTCKLKKQVNPTMDKGHYFDGVSVPFGQLPSNTVLVDDYPF